MSNLLPPSSTPISDTPTRLSSLAFRVLKKVPEVTIYFWIIKILTTAMGETTSDFLVSHINPLIAVASEIGRPQGENAPTIYIVSNILDDSHVITCVEVDRMFGKKDISPYGLASRITTGNGHWKQLCHRVTHQ